MNTRSLTGWLLIGGPVLTFVVLGALYPALVGNQDTAASSVKDMVAKPELARVLIGLGSIAFAAIFAGLTLLARSMQGDDKSGGAYASVAVIIFTGLTAIGIAATGLSAGALSAAADNLREAVMIEAVSSAMFTGLWFFWGIGSLLIGSAMVMQKNLHVVIAWLFVAFGVFVVVSSLANLNIPDVAGLVVWVGMTLVTAAAGFLHLRQAS